jgi:hypothetical protein
MRLGITEAERQRLLDRAIEAMRAWIDRDPDLSAHERGRLAERAGRAVTAAVVDAEHVHSLISLPLRCSGLQVVEMIHDPQAQARALVGELHNAELYVKRIKARIGEFGWAHSREYGDVSQVSRWLGGLRRGTLYDWIERAKQASETGTPAWLAD